MPDTDRRTRPRWRATVAIAVVGISIVVAVVVATSRGGASDGHGAGSAMFDLATVAPDVAEHYRFAADHEHELSQVPCFCGCERFLGHRHLYDCFVHPEGGWEAHAAGCAVCIAEAALIRDLLDDGQDVTAIREAVIARFGPVPPTVPAT